MGVSDFYFNIFCAPDGSVIGVLCQGMTRLLQRRSVASSAESFNQPHTVGQLSTFRRHVRSTPHVVVSVADHAIDGSQPTMLHLVAGC